MIAILGVHRTVLIVNIKHVKIYILVKVLLFCLVVSVFVCVYKHLSLYQYSIHCGSCSYRSRFVWSVQEAAVYWVCETVHELPEHGTAVPKHVGSDKRIYYFVCLSAFS